MFWLKKTIQFWLMPVPFCLVLLVASLAIGWSGRRPRSSRWLSALAALLLVLFSNKFVSNSLVRPLEQPFPPVPELGADAPSELRSCAFVVVLGGGNSNAPGMPATGKLSSAGLSRIVEAVRILKALPNATLMVSGPVLAGHLSHATILSQAAHILGVDPARITRIDTAHDTEEEAAAVARIAAGKKVALVTSAWHMRRAARLFRAAGVDFVPCPADFAGREKSPRTWSDYSWDSESLERSTEAVHEWLGLTWLTLRGVD